MDRSVGEFGQAGLEFLPRIPFDELIQCLELKPSRGRLGINPADLSVSPSLAARLYRETADEIGKRDTAEAETYWGGWNAYMGAMAQAGVMVGGNGLQPPATGTTLRLIDGARDVQDGPFADTKEMLGG